jgi:hypothetical protein
MSERATKTVPTGRKKVRSIHLLLCHVFVANVAAQCCDNQEVDEHGVVTASGYGRTP